MRPVLLLLVVALGGCAIVVDRASLDHKEPTGDPPSDGGAAPTGGACYAGGDPTFVTPREPTMSKDAACTATGVRKEHFLSEDEVWKLIVGSWVPCGSSYSSLLSHPGVVFGGDRTFRFLEDKDGELVATAVVGHVKLVPVSASQFGISVERDAGIVMWQIVQVGVGDRLEVNGEDTIARIAPGAAAIRTTYSDSGTCSLLGIWDSRAGVGDFPEQSSGTFAFDGKGHFQGGALGSDVCAPTIRGTYRFVGDLFQIVTSDGMGCATALGARWTVTFSADCRTANLKMAGDDCTGGRHSIEYDSVLTKK